MIDDQLLLWASNNGIAVIMVIWFMFRNEKAINNNTAVLTDFLIETKQKKYKK